MNVRTLITLVLSFCISTAGAQKQISICASAKDLSLVGKKDWYFVPRNLSRSGGFINDPALVYLKRLSDILKSNGTRLILAPTPSKAAVYSKFLPDKYNETYDWKPDLFRTQYTESLNRAKSAELLVPDLFKVADSFNSTSHQYFFHTDNHWTPYGARASAAEVVEIMKNDSGYSKLIKYAFKTTQDAKEISFVGISVGNLKYQCGNDITLETRPVFTTLAVNQNLLDDQETAITLLGTSFSNYTSIPANFAGFLSQYSGLNVANYGIAAGGSYYSTIIYFANEDYIKQRPRYIVWEFLGEDGINDVGAYRQIIPSVNKQCSQIKSVDFSSDKPITILTSDASQYSYIRINISDKKLLQIKIELRYSNSNESQTLVRRNIESNPGVFYYELKNEKGMLPSSVSVSAIGQPISNMHADICN